MSSVFLQMKADGVLHYKKDKSVNRYFTSVNDPVGIKAGDILVWKKESGNSNKLHVSETSMRKSFGLSIANRYGSLSHQQVKTLTRDPDITRYYLIDNTEQDPSGNTIFSYANIVEFPMTFSYDPEWNTLPFMASVSDRQGGFIRSLPGESFSLRSDEVMHAKAGRMVGDILYDDFRADLNSTIDNVIESLVTCDSKVFGYDSSGIRYSTPFEYSAETSEFISADCFADIAFRTTPVPKGSDVSIGIYKYRFPLKALYESLRRGAVILRPSEEFWRFWARKASEYVKRNCSSVYREIVSRLNSVERIVDYSKNLVSSRLANLDTEICSIDAYESESSEIMKELSVL